ncbi:Conserved_hypothetical protein [Hexamita inflata]|uniref:Uncharacterized protein n=1 Tax=Hexamita inflata TaxID=28002 RepID=A0AA86RJH7_9EUKA|nr:Conserved hypothetical protein [Hexamita inflata]
MQENISFPLQESFTYYIKTYEPLQHIPTCYDIINTRSKVYVEYYDMMITRMEHYPNIQYVFLTKNTKDEMYAFLTRFPMFMSKVNVAVYTPEMQKVVKTVQIPFCFIINDQNNIVYKGAVSTENYAIIISHLNEGVKRQQVELVQYLQNEKPNLQNRQLGLVMSGLQQKPQLLKKRKFAGAAMYGYQNLSFSPEHKIKNRALRSSLGVVRNGSFAIQSFDTLELGHSSVELVDKLDKLRLPNNQNENVDAKKRVEIVLSLPKLRKSQKNVDDWEEVW